MTHVTKHSHKVSPPGPMASPSRLHSQLIAANDRSPQYWHPIPDNGTIRWMLDKEYQMDFAAQLRKLKETGLPSPLKQTVREALYQLGRHPFQISDKVYQALAQANLHTFPNDKTDTEAKEVRPATQDTKTTVSHSHLNVLSFPSQIPPLKSPIPKSPIQDPVPAPPSPLAEPSPFTEPLLLRATETETPASALSKAPELLRWAERWDSLPAAPSLDSIMTLIDDLNLFLPVPQYASIQARLKWAATWATTESQRQAIDFLTHAIF